MKNAMKKIMSLMLVAMLLVSVFPMNAMALEDVTDSLTGNGADTIDSMVDGSSTVITDNNQDDAINTTDKIRSMSPEEGTNNGNVNPAPQWEVTFWNNTDNKAIGENNPYKLDATNGWNDIKTAKQLLNSLFVGWADDWTFDYATVKGERIDSEDDRLSIAAGHQVIVYLKYIPSYPVVIKYVQTQSNKELAEVTLETKRTISLEEIRAAVPESLNASVTVTEAHFDTNSKKIVSGNAYDISAHTSSNKDHGYEEVKITAMMDATDLGTNERPTLGTGSDVTNNPDVTVEDYANVRIILPDGSYVDKKVNVGTAGATINEILNFYGYNTNQFESAATRARSVLGLNSLVYNGDSITITLVQNSNNNGGNGGSTVPPQSGTVSGDTYYAGFSGVYHKFPKEIYLHVYLNNQVGTADRVLPITNGIALDGKVSLSEVKSLMKSYYTAKTDDGLNVDGIYIDYSNWVSNFSYDWNRYDAVENLDVARYDQQINLIVMVTNANRKAASTNTSDNPKTGDAIFMPVAVLGLSATALAVMFFYNKKRAY